MGFMKNFFNQTGRPSGLLGKFMLSTMNSGHAKLADWGFIHLPDILYSVRTHPDNLSTVKAKESNKAYCKVVRKHFKYLYDRLDTKEDKDALVNELMNRSVTIGMKWSAIRRIGTRRGGYWLRVLAGRVTSLFRRKNPPAG